MIVNNKKSPHKNTYKETWVSLCDQTTAIKRSHLKRVINELEILVKLMKLLNMYARISNIEQGSTLFW